MAQYTISLLTVLKNLARDRGKYYNDYESIRDFTEDNSNLIFDSYHIHDELHRSELNRKIVNHYLFDEISVVPYAKWKFMFNNKLEEIMPYYNKLYELEYLKFEDLLEDVDYTETLDRSVGTDTETTSNRQNNTLGTRSEDDSHQTTGQTSTEQSEDLNSQTSSESWESDVPFNKTQNDAHPTKTGGESTTGQSGNEYEGVENKTETRTGNRDVETTQDEIGSSSSLLDSDTKEDYEKTVKGKRSGVSKMQILDEYRKSLLNIDKMIIEELAVCFRFMLN